MLWSMVVTFFYQPVKNDLRTYDNIWDIVTDQGNDYTIDGLLDYPYFRKYYKMIFKKRIISWGIKNSSFI